MSQPLTRRSSEYTGSWCWGKIPQTPLHAGPHDTAKDVLEYRIAAEARVKNYDQILQNMAGLFGFPVSVAPATTKDEESSLRKLWDRTTSAPGNAHKITDYLRATIVVPENRNGVRNLERVIDTLINHPNVIGYKDQFFTPEPETGFRSFKALIDVEGHVSELIVQYEGFQPAAKITEGLRHFERTLREFENTADVRCGTKKGKFSDTDSAVARLKGNAAGLIAEIREIRTHVHEAFASDLGLNALLSPKLQEERAPSTLETLVKMFRSAHDNKSFGKGLKGVAGLLEQTFPSIGFTARPK